MRSIEQAGEDREGSEVLPFLLSFITSSKIIHLAQFNRDGVILFVNNSLAAVLKVPPEIMSGMKFSGFLTEADKITFARRLAAKEFFQNEELLMNLVDVDQIPHTIRCRFAPAGEGVLLLGEPLLDNNQLLQEELLQLNNQLAVLSRENIRKGRELAKTVKKLEETYEQLDKSFWHLRKIQEVLPICMECGMVKTAEASWEDVVSFLKKNSLFLSHGYCPVCADKVLTQYQKELKEGSL